MVKKDNVAFNLKPLFLSLRPLHRGRARRVRRQNRRGEAAVQARPWLLKATCFQALNLRVRSLPFNRPVSIYQPLGGFVFIFVYYLVFCDQSDDLVE